MNTNQMKGAVKMGTAPWLQQLKQQARQQQSGSESPAGGINASGGVGIGSSDSQAAPLDAPMNPTMAAQAVTDDDRIKLFPTATAAPTAPARPFIAPTDSSRDYREMYGEIYRFHQRHNPPILGENDSIVYWDSVTEDLLRIGRQFGNDRYMNKLLMTALDELEAEYKVMRDAALYGTTAQTQAVIQTD